jgi:hypothetical protein
MADGKDGCLDFETKSHQKVKVCPVGKGEVEIKQG